VKHADSERARTFIDDRQQQLDAFLHEISDRQRVMDGRDKIIRPMFLHQRHASVLWRLPF